MAIFSFGWTLRESMLFASNASGICGWPEAASWQRMVSSKSCRVWRLCGGGTNGLSGCLPWEQCSHDVHTISSLRHGSSCQAWWFACMPPRFVKWLLCSLDFMDFGCACGTSPTFPSIPNTHNLCRARGAGHYGYPPKSLPHCTGDLTPKIELSHRLHAHWEESCGFGICMSLLIPIYFSDGTLDLGSCDGQHINWTRRWVTRVKQQAPSEEVVGLDFCLSLSLSLPTIAKCRLARGYQCTTVGTSWCRTSLVQIRDTWHLLKSIGNIVRRPSWKVAGQLISCSHGDSIRQSIPLHVVAGFGHGNMLTGSKNQNLFMDRSAVAISVRHFSPVLSQVNWLCMQYLSQYTEPFLRSAWKGRSLFWWRTLWIFDTLYDLPRFSNHDSRFHWTGAYMGPGVAGADLHFQVIGLSRLALCFVFSLWF